MKLKQHFFTVALCTTILLSCAYAEPALPADPLITVSSAGVRLPVSFTAPGKGFFSMALYNQSGVLVRSLLSAAPVEKGTKTIEWDGTSDLGVAVAPGEYVPKGIYFTSAPAIDYVMKVGKSGNPPYRTPDGKGDWGANLGDGTSIVANSKSLMMGYAAVEDNQITGVQQTDTDGNIQLRYSTFYPWDLRMAAAMDETHYYLGIYSFDKKSTEIAEYKLGEPRGKILTTLPVKPVPLKSGRWKSRETSYLDGLALDKDTLYATVAHGNALFLVDRATGEIRKRIEINAPHGVAVAGNRLIVVSGNKVVALGLDGTLQSTLVNEGTLKAPNALALDKAGNFYVGDSGATFMLDPESEGGTRQVVVFSPTGKLLKKLGKTGGTPREGRFDANGFGIITALVLGPDNKLWAMDNATGFKRTSRWSLDGKVEKQWFHRKIQHVADIINPARPNEILSARGVFDDSPPGLYAHEIDLAAKTWKPSWFYEQTVDEAYRPAEGVFVSHEHNGNPFETGHPERRWPIFEFNDPSFVTHQDRDYVMSGDGNGEGSIHIYSPDKAPQPVALVSFHRAEKRDGQIHGFYDNGPNNWFSWADRDNDGRMSMGEVIYTENPVKLENLNRVANARLGPGLTIRLKLIGRVNGQFRTMDAVLPPKEILANGAPVYDWSLLRETVALVPPDFNGGDGTKKVDQVSMPVPVETEDAFYTIAEPGASVPLRLPGIDGDGWWASRNWRKKLVRFDKETGKAVWAVGRRAPGRAQPGQMYNPIMLAGEAGGALFVADAMPVVWVWNTDGLYLGRLYNDTGTGIANADTIYMEQQGTEIYTDPKTGKIYSIANDTGATIHEVTLPKTTPIESNSVTLSQAQIAQVIPWDPDGVAPTEKPTYQAYMTTRPMKIDGDLGDWWLGDNKPQIPTAIVLLDGQRLADVRAIYDSQNLYLSYSVQALNGPLNAGSELPISPFVSGAYVDFSIAPNWDGPRGEVREGDVRVILARIKEGDGAKDFQQGFWQKKADGANPQTITSPAAQVKFDHIAEVPGLQMAYKINRTDEKSGLTFHDVEVAVPLASLGLQNPVGKTVGFDASVAVANPEGNRRERAAHWAGLSEAVVVDRPGSTRLLPDTWGTLHFAPTP